MGRRYGQTAAPVRRPVGASRLRPDARLSILNLATFVVVGRAGSVSKAAAHLLVTRAAVSVAVQRLERQLEVQLLGRGKPKPLTPAGMLLFKRVDPIFRELEHQLAQPLDSPGET
jgi:DNA-binding transcriptional LysR family regulator